MSVSTDGQLNYGVAFEEEFEFPWSDDGDGDIENWWFEKIHQYKPPFELFDNTGSYINGVEPEDGKVSEYFSHRRAFEKEHPLPIEVVTHCSYDYPMYILSVGGFSASRGFPQEIVKQRMEEIEADAGKLTEFCKVYKIELSEEPKWILSSLWS